MVRTRCFTCGGPGSVPGWGTKILKAAQHGQKKEEEEEEGFLLPYVVWSKREMAGEKKVAGGRPC